MVVTAVVVKWFVIGRLLYGIFSNLLWIWKKVCNHNYDKNNAWCAERTLCFRGNYYNYRATISHFSNKKRIATCQEISKMG